MSSEVVLETDKHRFAQLPLKDRRSPGGFAVTQLVSASPWARTSSASALTPSMQLLEHVLAVAHETGWLTDGLAIVCLLAQLALVTGDAPNSAMLQYLQHAALIP